MYRADDSAASEKRSEDCKPERGEDQPHIPDLQHAAFFLHHHGMQEGRAREPGHERGVLDGVPSPVAAPSQDRIGPVGAEENSAGQKTPGDHGPAAGDVNPFLAGIFYDQSTPRKSEWHSEAHISQIKNGRG